MSDPLAKYHTVIKSKDRAVFAEAALELRRWMEVHDPHRPVFHTAGPIDFTFDVNGPIYHEGQYHLFYLNGLTPAGCWRGHLASDDLVHWKDWPAEMEANRGKMFGAGMSGIPLGTGVVDIKGVYEALVNAGYDGYTTLEVAGDDAVKQSYAYLKSLGAE